MFKSFAAGQSWYAQCSVVFNSNGFLQNSEFVPTPDHEHCQHFNAYAKNIQRIKPQWIFIYFVTFFILSNLSRDRAINGWNLVLCK